MTRKNKSRAAQRKLAGKGTLKKQDKEETKDGILSVVPSAVSEECADDTGIALDDLEDVILNSTSNDQAVSLHKEQLDSIATLCNRVDDHLISITTLQQQLAELQLKQLTLLDECVSFFQELQKFQATNEEEEKLLYETFVELRAKVKLVFKHFLPTQLEILERDMSHLLLNQNQI